MKFLVRGFEVKLSAMLILFISLFVNGCIEPYESIIEEETRIISIEGSIIKGEPVQSVVVSMTSPLIYPQFKTVRKCNVSVVDDLNNEYLYGENSDGTYSLEIPDNQLVFNRKYKLRVIVPNGEKYESEFETLNGGSEVDTVYHIIENKIDNLSSEELTGLQFYIDIKADDTTSRYYRWKLEETYEYTVKSPITFYYLDENLEPVLVDNQTEFYRCWKTNKIRNLILSNTVNLTINEKKRIPLYYVSNVSDRLKIKYSLLVNQYTLSEGAYNYWQKNKIATQESGGLYTQQPGLPVTNIMNVNDSTEQVLGYFWISNKTVQRLMVPRISSLPVIGEHCDLTEFTIVDHGKGPFPVYIWFDEITRKNMTGSPFCFICTLKGGSLTQPDYWDQN